MAKYSILYTCHEVQLDDDGCVTKEYKKNLPHSKQIVKELCDQWNKDAKAFMLDLVNKECFDRCASCNMKQLRTTDGTTTVAIEFVAKPGKQLTTKVKDAIGDFMDTQFSDGWGEGMFGHANIMTASDGTRFCIE